MSDEFAKGMSEWAEEDDRSLDRYRLWQMDLIRPFLGEDILEMGAGHGKFATIVGRTHPYRRYVALEPSEHFFPALKAAGEKLPNFTSLNVTVDAVVETGFDTAFSIHVMEHVEDDFAFLREAYDRLLPGGHLITLVPALQFLYSDLDKKIGHFRRYDRAMMRTLAARLGAEVVLNRYDNLIGVAGWWWICKIRGIDYHSAGNKKALVGYFDFFSRRILPMVSRIEKHLPPPIGLNLTCVLRKPR